MEALRDKVHVLLICLFYSEVRNKYLKQCYQSKPVSYLDCLHYYLLGKGGFVFGSVGLSVCLFVDNITQKVMNGLG